MNSASSPDPIESISNRGQLQSITPVSTSGSNSAINLNIQRYSRSTLYLIRNDVRSRRRPECAIRADLMALGVWRINGGSGSYQQNGNGNEAGAASTNNSSSNLNSGALPTYTRGQRSPSTRTILSSTEHIPSTQYVSHSHANQKNYIDHRTISSAHLMPAFAKRRIGMPPQIAASSYAPSTSSGPRPETPSDSGQSVKDFPYTSRQKGKDQLQERQHGDDSQSSVAYLSPQRKNMGDYDREGNHSTSASPAASSGPTNTRHSIGNTSNERRIGSGRLLHCDVNWDYRNVDKDNNRTSNLSDKEALFSNHPQQQSRTSASFTERGERSNFIERRSFDRRNTDVESRDKYENKNSNSHSSGCSSRRFISKDMESNSSSVQISEQHPVTHIRSRRHHYNERNDEPEWFSGGPTSQHDTIELRGFDEPEEQFGGAKKSLPRKLSESPTSRASSNLNLSHTKSKDMQHTAKEQMQDKDNDSDDKVVMNKSSAANTKCSTNNSDQQSEILEKNDKNNSSGQKDTLNSNEKVEDSKIELKTNNAQFGLTEFNFDAFLNMDPLTHSLMGTDVKPDEDLGTIGSSRFSRWFCNKNSQLDVENHTPSNMMSDETGDNITAEVLQRSPDPSESPIMKQSNKLMQFLQRGKLPAALLECTQPHVGGIPSVEELESRMRKNRSAKESTNSNEEHQQAKLFNKPNIREIGKLPEQSTASQTPTTVPTTPQDTEAFKKLLEQLGSANKLDSPLQSNINISGTQQQYNQDPENPPSAFILVQQQQKHHGIVQNTLPPHVSNNEEISKFIQQQQFIHQQQRMLQQNALQHAQSDAAFTPTYVPTSVVVEKSRNEAINSLQGMPSPREVHFHSQTMMQNAIMKKKLEEHENFRRRQELQKHQILPNPTMPGTQQHPLDKELNQKTLHQHQLQAGLPMQQPSHQNLQTSPQQHQQTHQTHHSHLIQHQQRQINSPTPLAFTPTSVLRKMTAEKDNSISVSNTQHQQAANQIHTQQQRQPQNHHQMSNNNLQSVILNQQLMQQQSQVINSNVGPQPQQQPRMILGGGNHQHQQAQLGGGGQLLTQQQQQSLQQQHPSIHAPQQAQRLRNNQQQQLKWPVPPVISQQQIPINKPIGRPILKGPLPTAQSQQQKLQQQQMSPMNFASKIEMQQIQQQQKLKINPTLQHMQQQPFPMSQQQQQTKTNIMTQVQQHLFQQQQQQRAAALQRAQHIQLQHIHQQQQHLNRSTGSIAPNQQQSAAGGSTSTPGNATGIMNYQRDGGLSPTSNQLAQWFSPELLAQASAGKLPLLNMNQALSLEEFERSIQHSSTAVHN